MKHNNPKEPRIYSPKGKHRGQRIEQWARAPYNFIPLPDKVIEAPQPILGHDAFHVEGNSCWIDCELTTMSPTYIRGMLAEEDYKKQSHKEADQLTPEDKAKRAPFFATSNESINGAPKPVIPGSSLRGMVRHIMEIITHANMRWVGQSPTFGFRAVAAQRDDPLRDPYRDVIGSFSKNVRAGYLVKIDDKWFVQPAKKPSAMPRWPKTQDNWIKINESSIPGGSIPGFVRLNDRDYKPQWHKVSFGVEIGRGSRGQYIRVSQIGSGTENYQFRGTLVCSGNMLETDRSRKSPRKKHALVLEPDERAERISIKAQAITDYINSLSPFQKESLEACGKGDGCLPLDSEINEQNGSMVSFLPQNEPTYFAYGPPVFFVLDSDGKKISYFGHSPNFRIPARLHGSNRAATPRDFVPEHLTSSENPDMVEAIFGWVEDKEDRPNLKNQRAGRVFFGDAEFVSAENDVWLSQKEIIPQNLASPKPTSFQHYLSQNSENGHNPDRLSNLAYYGSNPSKTEIRGYKMYWHKGKSPQIERAPDPQKEKQLTRIRPIMAGVTFKFRIYFENLRDEELGALLWALELPFDKSNQYCHKIGMGKPLGMGAVKIKSRLTITDRTSRYSSLFADNRWHTASREVESQSYINRFEAYINERLDSGQPFKQNIRIEMLAALLKWRESNSSWEKETSYMQIGSSDSDTVNEYATRPVLPDPIAVSQKYKKDNSAKPKLPTKIENPQKIEDLKRGEVKYFGRKSGKIIEDESNRELSVHKRDLSPGVSTLHDGQTVLFLVEKDMKGKLKAVKVRPI